MGGFFSSGAFGGMEPEAMVAEVSSYPGMGVEFTAGQKFSEGWEERWESLGRVGVPLLIHNYFPPPERDFVLNLAAVGEAELTASRSMALRALEWTAKAGAPFYSVHAGFAMEVKAGQLGRHEVQARELVLGDVERSRAIFLESVEMLAQRARELGVRLLLENNVVSPVHREAGLEMGLFLATPGEVATLMEKWSEWPVGLLLDVGHAKVAGETLGFDPRDFFALGQWIGGLHLSENDGRSDSNRGFEEGVWFGEFLGAGGGLPWVIEVYGLGAEERRQQYETVRRLIET